MGICVAPTLHKKPISFVYLYVCVCVCVYIYIYSWYIMYFFIILISLPTLGLLFRAKADCRSPTEYNNAFKRSVSDLGFTPVSSKSFVRFDSLGPNRKD
jgi:hypothetical protein